MAVSWGTGAGLAAGVFGVVWVHCCVGVQQMGCCVCVAGLSLLMRSQVFAGAVAAVVVLFLSCMDVCLKCACGVPCDRRCSFRCIHCRRGMPGTLGRYFFVRSCSGWQGVQVLCMHVLCCAALSAHHGQHHRRLKLSQGWGAKLHQHVSAAVSLRVLAALHTCRLAGLCRKQRNLRVLLAALCMF